MSSTSSPVISALVRNGRSARYYETVSNMLAATDSVSTDDLIQMRGFVYQVAQSNANDFHLQRGDGVKLYHRPTGNIWHFDAFGPAGDGETDDYDTFVDFYNALPIGAVAWFSPGKTYYMGTTIQLKKVLRLASSGSGMSGHKAAVIKFASDITGIIVHRTNTYGVGLDDGSVGGSADGSVIEGLSISGEATEIASDFETGPHGIWLRARATVRNCLVTGFGGNGISVIGAVSTGIDSRQGNPNQSNIETCRSQLNWGWGLWFEGADANACVITNVDCTDNGRGGFYDGSLLGNTYIGCHAANNGKNDSPGNLGTKTAMVSFGGQRYTAELGASEQELVDTEPGTDSTVWRNIGAGNAFGPWPLWQASQTVGTYFFGASYYCGNQNARGVYVGCYSELNAPGSWFNERTMIVGGLHGANIWGPLGNYLRSDINGFLQTRHLEISNDDLIAFLGTTEASAGEDKWGILTLRTPNDIYTTRLRRSDYGSQKNIIMQRDQFADAIKFWIANDETLNAVSTIGFNGFNLGTETDHIGVVPYDGNTLPSNGTEVVKGWYLYKDPAPSSSPGFIVTTAGTVGADAVICEMPALGAAV
jgi:hypothetical protein